MVWLLFCFVFLVFFWFLFSAFPQRRRMSLAVHGAVACVCVFDILMNLFFHPLENEQGGGGGGGGQSGPQQQQQQQQKEEKPKINREREREMGKGEKR